MFWLQRSLEIGSADHGYVRPPINMSLFSSILYIQIKIISEFGGIKVVPEKPSSVWCDHVSYHVHVFTTPSDYFISVDI